MTGTVQFSCDFSGSVARPVRAGTPMRSPRYGKLQHSAENFAVERRADVGIGGVADTKHAADVQQLHRVAGLELSRQVSGIASQRVAVTQRTDDNVAHSHGRHPSGRQFQLVVARLVVEHARGDQHTFLARDLPGKSNLGRQVVCAVRPKRLCRRRYFSLLPRPGLQAAAERQHAGIAECVGRRPLTGRLTINALGGRQQRVGRFDPFDEQLSRAH